MKKAFLAVVLFAAVSYAALPTCDLTTNNTIARDSGKYYQCSGGTWNLMYGAIVDTTSSQAIFGDKTFREQVIFDAGMSMAAGSTLVGQDAGFWGVTLNNLIATNVTTDRGDVAGNWGVDGGVVIHQQRAMTNHAAANQAMECGSDAGTTGALSVTFSTAFSAAPVCTCTHVDTTNTNACTLLHTSLPSTAGAVFAVASGGTDVIDWCCVGAQ